MASPSSSFSQSPPSLFPLHHRFSAIPEGEGEEEGEAQTAEDAEGDDTKTAAAADRYQHRPTPLHPATPSFESAASRPAAPRKAKAGLIGEDERVVSCNKCRPSAREKISVVPLQDGAGKGGHGRKSSFSRSPKTNGGLKSFFSSLTWRSPRPSFSSSGAPPEVTCSREEEWRLAAAELSHKLIHATRQRDEALLEASRLKHSMADLEKKLTGLEHYCHELKSAVDLCEHANPRRPPSLAQTLAVDNKNFPLEHFLSAVAESRSATRQFSRSLVAQIRRAGAPPKVHERILQLLQPGDARVVSGSRLLVDLEALLSRLFFEDFESAGFQRGGPDRVLDPRTRAESHLASYAALRALSWADVLSRGTRRYCEDFSRFCDRKMSDVAGTVLEGGLLPGKGGGAWPEPLLRAFFGAAKGAWLVHLLAWCDHPAVPLFRVGKGVPFDARYMEDVAATRATRLAPAAVKVMVAPGFYVADSVVKCKVLCVYRNASVVDGDAGKSKKTQ